MVFFATASLIKGSGRRKVAFSGQFKVLFLPLRRGKKSLVMGSLTTVGDRNAVTQVNTNALDEGRPLSRPQAVCLALNRHHTGAYPTFGYVLSDASGYNGKKDAYRRYTRGRNASGSGRWK